MKKRVIRFPDKYSVLLRCIRPPVVVGMAPNSLGLLAQSYATLYEDLFELLQTLKEAVGYRLVGQRP
jgi:hypothetical protein